jgi:asparagine synthase (glutamine-hydrolysing)
MLWKNGSILSHERLSIIDLHSGKQPIQGTKYGYVVHNGEILQSSRTKRRYIEKHTFRTKSDSEVIVHLYEEFE